jgi:hypothetical protein
MPDNDIFSLIREGLILFDQKTAFILVKLFQFA